MLIDEKGQISAEMILLLGAILIIVIIAGIYVFSMAQSIGNNINDVVNAARDSTIGKM
jgi:uncharacterized protein (UPF0333 family)